MQPVTPGSVLVGDVDTIAGVTSVLQDTEPQHEHVGVRLVVRLGVQLSAFGCDDISQTSIGDWPSRVCYRADLPFRPGDYSPQVLDPIRVEPRHDLQDLHGPRLRTDDDETFGEHVADILMVGPTHLTDMLERPIRSDPLAANSCCDR